MYGIRKKHTLLFWCDKHKAWTSMKFRTKLPRYNYFKAQFIRYAMTISNVKTDLVKLGPEV